MNLVPIVLPAVLVVVPIVLVVYLVRKRHPTRLDWLVAAVSAAGLGGYVLLVGRWDFSYYLRPLVALGLLVALVVSLVRSRRAPWWKRPDSRRGWITLGINVVVAALFAGFAGYAISGLSAGGVQHANLAFPLRNGVSHVGQGGAIPLLNYHNTIRAQAYALDIVALNPAGMRAWGLTPSELDRYTVFEWDVHSPCAGTVVEARDGLADLIPPATDTTNRSGNHVVIRCSGTEPAVDVLLAHLRQGSVTVDAHREVAVGDVVGKVGNTGNTSEPHLHVHAVRTGSGTILDGEGVPIRFDGRFLVRNDLVFPG